MNKELVRKNRHKAELPVTAVLIAISLAMYAAVRISAPADPSKIFPRILPCPSIDSMP